MSHETEIERYVKDPNLLVELCREVVERLDTGSRNADVTAMEVQLREIARAIDKLDKQGVPVPEALRAEKTRLAAALGVSAESTQILNHLAEELDILLKDIRLRTGCSEETITTKKPRSKTSKSPKTDMAVLRKLIIEALQHFGGSASKNDVLDYMKQKLQGKLLPGDIERRDSTNDYVWQNNACWERNTMKSEGIIKEGSRRGIWELSEVSR